MSNFIQGLPLCEGFFLDEAKPLLDRHFPNLPYAAGLIGYGSDVLGYDDEMSRDHMWGPRFYLFLRQEDMPQKEAVFRMFSENLPYEYKGFSVNFTEPDPNDNGVQHPQLIHSGKVNPLIFIQTPESFLAEELGTADLEDLTAFDWLAFSEHRLLSLVSGKLFVDKLGMKDKLSPLRYYPREVKNYLIASNWDIIASEQAFVKRCGLCGDEAGSILICARIVERLMRLCFLYKEVYAPYSKWFGTAFAHLDLDSATKAAVLAPLTARTLEEREDRLAAAQATVAALHNQTGITEPVPYKIESYFGRDIKVIYADKFAQAVRETLQGTALDGVPLIGSLSQLGGLCVISDDHRYSHQIKSLYQ